MKKSICLYFQVHQPTRLRLYRFFDIGKDSHYYDDFANRTILKRIVQKCYQPMNDILLEAIKACDVLLKGPTTTPHGGWLESANVVLRRELDLYSNVRPVRVPEKGSGELRELAENYNTMATQLERLDKTRNQFVSNASHELKRR